MICTTIRFPALINCTAHIDFFKKPSKTSSDRLYEQIQRLDKSLLGVPADIPYVAWELLRTLPLTGDHMGFNAEDIGEALLKTVRPLLAVKDIDNFLFMLRQLFIVLGQRTQRSNSIDEPGALTETNK